LKNSAPFTIYNASAGSGKTFTLVKEYLKLIIASNSEGYYRNLLAITFTNKAVAEMKQRIIDSLVTFSEERSLTSIPPMMQILAAETELEIQEVHQRSKKILQHLLHHYAGFNVETIDRFNHQLLRTFARDLSLSTNFEVSLDIQELLDEAVDQLISKAGEDKKITKVLLDFALAKADDDKSWDISKDIARASKILFNETEREHTLPLRQKTLDDFLVFAKALRKKIKIIDANIAENADEVLQSINSANIPFEDFMRSTCPNHFLKLSEGNYDVYGNKLEENLETCSGLYKKATNANIAASIDSLAPFLLEKYRLIKSLVFQQKLFASALKNIVPLSVINLVSQEIDKIKEDRNILPISEFNAIINNEIKDQPAPFIYERLGEKYRHYFIDEFQDTSQMQWENLVPLVDNALSQQDLSGTNGSLLLVGDAKQSIYRWRGGLPEQFMHLYQKHSPFSSGEPTVENLDTNYRSREEVIDFNNAFFTHISQYFGDAVHKELYTLGNAQNKNSKKGGYVKVEFVDAENKEESNEIYCKKTFETIQNLTASNYTLRDICILTRTKKDGVALGVFLLENKIPVISGETLLLQYSKLVQCLINALTLYIYPKNEETRISLLDFLHRHFGIEVAKHTFFSEFIHTSPKQFSEKLSNYGIGFSLEKMRSLTLYESCEYVISAFGLEKLADAYLFGFMDLVYDYVQQPQADTMAFLQHWETKKQSASIPTSEGINAVQIMTIHKSKGLEFPIVIFPYADLDIYKEMDAKIWFPMDAEEFGFAEVQINYNNDVATYGDTGIAICENRRNTLELDALNILYVTLTRAVDQLYIFSEKPKPIKDGKPSCFNQFFASFLAEAKNFEVSQMVYEFGNFKNKEISKEVSTSEEIIPSYISSDPEVHNLHISKKEAIVWQTGISDAISAGNLLHDTMMDIRTASEKNVVMENLEKRSIISDSTFKELDNKISEIIQHNKIRHLFEGNDTVFNERDIITAQGFVLRPDRLNVHSATSATILDYKTGTPSYEHEDQINGYALALKEMGFTEIEKLLVYTSEADIVINKV